MNRRSFLLTACIWATPAASICQPQAVRDVSLVALIANPQQFDGARVRVIGYLHLEFEGNCLYLSKADYDHAVRKNAVWIDPPTGALQSGISDGYVLAEGIFEAKMGHMNLNSGTIESVSRLERWNLGPSGNGP